MEKDTLYASGLGRLFSEGTLLGVMLTEVVGSGFREVRYSYWLGKRVYQVKE